MKNVKVSFDFDGTLDYSEKIQKYAKELVDKGYEVWVITRRYKNLEDYTPAFCAAYNIINVEEEHNNLFTVIEACGIPIERVHYTNMTDKYKYFKDKDFLWHLDDDYIEISNINIYTKTVAVSVYGNWKSKCNNLIKRYVQKRRSK